MANGYSADDLLEFLAHASERGLMPAATAQALGVASRNVFGVLDSDERADLRTVDVAALLKRFANKRARDFNPTSLKEYGRRVQRAIDHFVRWREDPANFSVKARATAAARKRERVDGPESAVAEAPSRSVYERSAAMSGSGYQSAFPIRPGSVVTIANIPVDLTPAEAERLATFVRMLAVDG